ncbi:hypothetical protein ES708_28849 [subsurface metagenome]
MPEKGVNLIPYELSPLQAALIEYLKKHPYITFEKLKVHEGVPLEAQVNTGFGTETIRFDRIAKEAGLIE